MPSAGHRLGFVLLLVLATACATPTPERSPAAAAPCAEGSAVAPVAATTGSSAASSEPPVAHRRRAGISEASKRLVCDKLSSTLKIEAYFSKGLVDDGFVDTVKKLFDAYTTACPSKSKVKAVVVTVETEDQALAARNAGLSERKLQAAPEDTVDLRRGFCGFALSYEGKTDALPFWPQGSDLGLEFFLTSKARELYVRASDTPIRVGVLVGKGGASLKEPSLAEQQSVTIRDILGQYFPYYVFTQVEASDKGAIDPALAGLIVMQPDQSYSQAELKRIDEFLLLGKTVAFFVSAVNVKPSDRTMGATLDRRGLEPLLSGYGIELADKAVLDEKGGLTFTVLDNSGKQSKVTHAGIPLVDGDRLDASFAPFAKMRAVPFPLASPLVLHGDKQPDAKLRVVARTTKTAIADGARTQDFSRNAHGSGPGAETPVAVVLEGKIKSAFSGTKSKASSRVLVVSSSQFLTNPFVRAGSPPPMPPQLQMMGPQPGDPELMAFGRLYTERYFLLWVLAVKNTLDWVGGEPEYADLSADLLEGKGLLGR